MTTTKRHVWKPIKAWNIEWHKNYLPEVFAGLRGHLPEEDWQGFNERCAREWSIETGQIENAFDLDRGVTLQLIREGFVSSLIGHQRNGLSPEQVHAILMDTKDALDGLFAFVKSEQPLTTSYIKQLHQQLMANVDSYDVYFIDPVTRQRKPSRKLLEKGKYKDAPNSPLRGDTIDEYCPPEEVPGQMEELVRIFNEYDAARTPAEVRASWIHHVFTQIHPFQDGNGRVARALASLVLIQGGLPAFTVVRSMKPRYIDSLERADDGNAIPLISFFESCLYRQIIGLWRHLKLARTSTVTVNAKSGLDTAIATAIAAIAAKSNFPSGEWIEANKTMDALRERSKFAFSGLAKKLSGDLKRIASSYRADLVCGQSSSITQRLASIEKWDDASAGNGYLVETVSVLISSGAEASIIASFDPFSGVRKGICGAAITFVQGNTLVSSEPSFFFNFKEPHPEGRFDVWLDQALERAVVAWQQELTK